MTKLLPQIEPLYALSSLKDHPLHAALSQVIRMGLFHPEHVADYLGLISWVENLNQPEPPVKQAKAGSGHGSATGTYVKQFIHYIQGVEARGGYFYSRSVSYLV